MSFAAQKYRGAPLFGTLSEILTEAQASLVAMTGGGGKSSLLYGLGAALCAACPVLLTTTTKIFKPKPEECANVVVGPLCFACELLRNTRRPAMIAAAAAAAGEKLVGYEPEELSAIKALQDERLVIAECDGSRGRSVKHYESWEPPVPQRTDVLFAVAGADALFAPVCEASVFRAVEFCAEHSVAAGGALSVPLFMKYLTHENGPLKNAPASAKKIILINKCENLPEPRARELYAAMPALLEEYDAAAAVSMKEDKIFLYLSKK
ncbi:MAG: selenium cofactor biosynthesis protein YqeC [Cloacibacillus sp.]